VYCSAHVSDDEAAATLLAHLDGKPLADPRPIRFRTGMRRLAWNENVIAIGLAGGFLEPLESTSIHLIQQAVQQLLDFFPDRGFSAPDIAEFNRHSRFHWERIRDFIILHYHLNQRDDSAFWQACAHMAVPDTLREKLDLYRSHGRVVRRDNELFSDVGWIQVMEGQNLVPHRHHPLAELKDEQATHEYLEGVREVIAKCVDFMPDHAAYIADHCASPQR
jgi:tryptophan halogenase